MDIEEFIQTRRRAYLAQTLEAIERELKPHLDLNDPAARAVYNEIRAIVRKKIQGLCSDFSFVMGDLDIQVNYLAVQQRDRLAA